MPVLGAVLFALDIAMAFHAVKTGRFSPWFFIIIMLPGIGALAYVIMVLIPEWSDSYHGRTTRSRVTKALDPEGAYRALKVRVDIADTIANRAALAQECLALGRHDEAWEQYHTILGMHLGDAPEYMAGRARAEFGQGRFTQARATLDDLRRRWPDWQSADSHLLYARTLEKDGHLADAVDEYRAVSEYYAGAEPRVRLGLALRALGREDEGRAVLTEVVQRLQHAPRFARQTQAVWISMAQAALRG